jgi:hypothetical protein
MTEPKNPQSRENLRLVAPYSHLTPFSPPQRPENSNRQARKYADKLVFREKGS